MFRVILLGTLLAFLSHAQTAQQLPPAASGQVNFTTHVQPILQARCYACHGEQLQLRKLRLDRRADAIRGGESGIPAIVPGDSANSLLIRYVAAIDPDVVMPPEGDKLTPDQVGLLRAWIDQGAAYPAGAAEVLSESARPASGRSSDRSSDHWAFQPVRRPRVPQVSDTEWVRNPIDAFVTAKLEHRGWKPSAPAKPRALLRRLYLDLIGLPPALEEQAALLKDPSPENFDRLVDDLLRRPGYGERWARHWLDLVRYAETNGYERDAAKPHVWRYRDYVIRAFNDDKRYDQFIVEQLAGDEVDDVSPETLIALGYNRLGPWDDEPADFAQDRFDQLDDIVTTTSQVFLGMTLGCARCHNHKFDPLTARDYYGMVAIFDGLVRPQTGRTEHDLPLGSRLELDQIAAIESQIAPFAEQIEALKRSHWPAFLRSGKSTLDEESVKAFLADASQRTPEQERLVKRNRGRLKSEAGENLPDELTSKIAGLEQAIAPLRESMPDLSRGYFLHEPSPEPPPTHLLLRGSAHNRGPETSPAVPVVLADAQPRFPSPRQTSLRRLTLAHWIANPDNPLTARVIVNRIWQHHFGEGLVRTPSNFGKIGELPTHPELLDWLASWFIDNGWSLKKLHRLILTSNSYRMSKQWNAEYGAEDPESRLLWRVPYTRLEVEPVRDSMLAVTGRLNRKMYGPSMLPAISEAALAGHSDPDKIWKPSPEDEASRRTIYAFIKRSMVIPMLEVLDLCDTTRSTAKRTVTSVAPQALTLFNGDFVNEQARYFAERLVWEVGLDPEKQIERAYLLAFARPPTRLEQGRMTAFLSREAAAWIAEPSGRPRDPAMARRHATGQMCRVILNLNEFVYTD